MPFDVAFALCADGGPENDVESWAMSVALGEMDGGEFDWRHHKWIEKNA